MWTWEREIRGDEGSVAHSETRWARARASRGRYSAKELNNHQRYDEEKMRIKTYYGRVRPISGWEFVSGMM